MYLGQNKPHKCGECDASFSEGSQLRNHLVKQHNQVAHPVCATSFLLLETACLFIFVFCLLLRVPLCDVESVPKLRPVRIYCPEQS